MKMRAVFIILNMCHAVRVTGVLFHAISPIPKPSNKYPDKLKKNQSKIISEIRIFCIYEYLSDFLLYLVMN